MGQLEADQEVVGVPAAFPVLVPRERDELLQLGEVLLRKEELARVGAAFGDDGAGLAPEDLGSAPGEAAPAVVRDLVRLAVEGPVAALHRMDDVAVADGPMTDAAGLEGFADLGL